MKRLLLTIACLVLAAPAYGQHVHMTPHTTTHYDTYRHGNHTHTVPHTTTHYDAVYHSTAPAYVPHTTTHYDSYRHGNHTHTVPHTTTHLDPVYPSTLNAGMYSSSFNSGYNSPSYGSSSFGSSSYGSTLYGSGLGYPSLNYPSAAPAFSTVTPNMGIVTPNASVNAPSVGGIVSAAPPATVEPGYSTSKPINNGGAATNSLSPNVIPSEPTPARGDATRKIVLTNPADSGGSIKYVVNEFPYTIAPGQAQTLNMDRDWTIRFDNGLGRIISYRLQEGNYRFTVSQDAGWNVGKVPAQPEAPVAPELSQKL